ncbi:hypothetical protein M5D96_000727 [Drosophila gunungcola]|uniref:Uncharacterized protein n=1 Tax=Drosophila gunungcola TaxID=103775 RepID=A0A9P9YXF0_9MUSC|nr:hypothetical protein M5D96_000727 [Drosophila gunungcola]
MHQTRFGGLTCSDGLSIQHSNVERQLKVSAIAVNYIYLMISSGSITICHLYIAAR